MSPPAAQRHTSEPAKVERRDQRAEHLIRVAEVIVNNCGASWGHSKLSRVVRRYVYENDGHGMSFFYYLAHMLRLNAERQRELLNRPDVARAISYADPTGETAVRNVMRAGT